MEDKKKQSASSLVREIKRRTRRVFSSEQKIQIVLEGLRGEESVSAICRKYGIHENNYYNWSKDFMEAGKKRLSGDTERDANTSEVKDLKVEHSLMKKDDYLILYISQNHLNVSGLLEKGVTG